MLLISFTDGQRLSIERALSAAHTLGDIRGNSVLETYSLYRFLAAVLQGIYTPNEADLRDLQTRGQFDPARIAAFCAQHPMAPATFGQVPGLEGKVKTLGYVLFGEPAGADSLFFRPQSADKAKTVCEQCVWTGLLSLTAWQTIGGQGLTASINGTPPLYFLPQADNLFETLVRCLVPDPNPCGGIWDRPITYQFFEDVPYLHGLTFMPRRVRVLWQTGGEEHCTRCGAVIHGPWARDMVHVKGEKYIGQAWRDPFVAYIEKEGRTYPLALRQAEAAYGAAIRKGLGRVTHRPQLFALWPEQKAWRVFGAVTNQAKWEDSFVTDIELTEELTK